MEHAIENKFDNEDAQFFKTIADFNQTISCSLDLEKTVHSILENISQIIPADLIELNIWDDDGTNLIPYQIEMNSNEYNGVLVREKQKIGDGYTGLIIKENQPCWLEDMENNPNNFVSSTIEIQRFHSFMGFPLVVGHEVLGTLEFFKGEKSGFSKIQFDAIENICLHIATSINNAILFREENQKALELSSLAQLAQSVSFSKEPEKIFEKMLATIAPMIPVEIIGFLLYNNSTNMLEAQNPFIGLPTPFIEIFKTEIKKESNAEKLLISQDVLLTENAQVDLHWIILGLDHIARAASIRESVLIPLISGGVSLGFIMASNHTKKALSFSPTEMHLLMIVANQAAPIIENMILVNMLEK
jgi:transcriptional regulator with GAF, ATPase, and Fis domain